MQERLQLLQQKIRQHTTNFRKPTTTVQLTNIKTNSWFNIEEYNTPLFDIAHVDVKQDIIEHDGYYTKKIKLILEDWQKQILIKWMDAYIYMFNETTRYFKKQRFKGNKSCTGVTQLRVKLMKKKNKIHELSKLHINNRDIYVDRHLLDYAINDSINRYKSCLTNLRNGNIKHFRLRYLSPRKSNKIIKLEKCAFSNNCFYSRTFRNVRFDTNHDIDFKDVIVTTSIIQYLEHKDEFMLLIKYRKEINKNMNTHIIALDPGVRTPFCGYSNKGIINIGTNINKHLKIKLKKIDSITEDQALRPSRRKQLKKRIYEKMHNRINDYHWKTINYLTNNYGTIVIGDLSTKTMGERNMDNMTKRVANMLNLFKFKEKLKYKCSYTETKYKLENESYTSKCCSSCGYQNNNLGSAKFYICPQCNVTIGRDVNGALNILLKSAT